MDSGELDPLAIGSMIYSFDRRGPQDWQRRYTNADGTPGDPNDPIPAFRQSTSFILGYVTARSRIPLEAAEMGGGWLNLLTKWYTGRKDIDTSGSHGNNPENLRSMRDGFQYGNGGTNPATYRWDRLYLEENKDAVRAKFDPGHNNAVRGQQSGGRDMQLESYRYAPSDDSTPTTVTPAMRALNAAKADDVFTKRYLSGDRDAVDRMHALHRAAYPEPSDTTVGPTVRPDASDIAADGFSAGIRDLTPARHALKAAKADSGFVKRYLDGDRSAFDRMQSLIQAAYPEPAVSGRDSAESGASTPIFQPWTLKAATEGLAPWMQSSLKDYLLSSSSDGDSDGSSKLAPWMRDQYPAWLRGNGG